MKIKAGGGREEEINETVHEEKEEGGGGEGARGQMEYDARNATKDVTFHQRWYLHEHLQDVVFNLSERAKAVAVRVSEGEVGHTELGAW